MPAVRFRERLAAKSPNPVGRCSRAVPESEGATNGRFQCESLCCCAGGSLRPPAATQKRITVTRGLVATGRGAGRSDPKGEVANRRWSREDQHLGTKSTGNDRTRYIGPSANQSSRGARRPSSRRRVRGHARRSRRPSRQTSPNQSLVCIHPIPVPTHSESDREKNQRKRNSGVTFPAQQAVVIETADSHVSKRSKTKGNRRFL
jgi:hypothetical protein